jgi:hypothetical protein
MYKMVPIADLADLADAKATLMDNPGDFQSVVMLNAGGTIDILAEFEAEEEGSPLAGLTFYIIDAHRLVVCSHRRAAHAHLHGSLTHASWVCAATRVWSLRGSFVAHGAHTL